ncbi:MAG: hypothetical protein IJY28_08370 [Clostridia bacterium]|nr:hypothetical protein [Clostridia bacterium]
MKKIWKILLAVVLVMLIAAGSCVALAAAEPEEGVFAGMMGEESIDLTKLLNGLLSGNIRLPYPALNRTLQESLVEAGMDTELTGLCMAPSEAAGKIWVRAWVDYDGRTWTTTMLLRMEIQSEGNSVTALAFDPEKITVGKLPVPEMLWPVIMEQMAEQTDLPYGENGTILYSLPEMDLGFLRLTDIRAEQDGFVLQFGIANPLG